MKKFCFTYLILLLIVFLLPYKSLAVSDLYTWSTLDLTAEVSAKLEKSTANITNPLNFDCGSCILIDSHSGQVLYSYNEHESLRPASVTKVMSIYLIMEAISQGKVTYDTKIPCSKNAESMGGSQIWLSTTETLTVDEMLKAICIVSANDCVTAMAEFIGGTEENFVTLMNEKAKDLRYE